MAPNSQDAIRDTLNSAIHQIVSSLEPQLNQFAQDFANRAVERSRDLMRTALDATKRQPWLLVGTAAILLVSTAAIFGVSNRRALKSASATGSAS